MAEISIRFGITDGVGHRAGSWKCWSNVGTGKNDVYLALRKLGHLKASFHQTGDWHIAFDYEAFPLMFEESNKPLSRFAKKWSKPTELASGFLLPCRILVPWYAATVPESTLDSRVTWIHTAPADKAIEFAIIITSASRVVDGWPTRTSMKTELAGCFTLDSGDRVWVVHHVVDWVDPVPRTGRPRFAKGKTVKDLEGEGLRAIAWSEEPDGSITFYDLPAAVRSQTSAS